MMNVNTTGGMNTLSEVLEKLRLKGNDNEIKMSDDGHMTSTAGRVYQPDELTIIKTYRFEGDSDPADNSVLYIVADDAHQIGYIMDVYGVYSDHEGPLFDDFLKKIPVSDREDQELFS